MLYVTRRATFSASHRLFNPEFSEAKNDEIFDKCNNPNGHGHNYTLEVTVAGHPDPDTGYVIDLKVLADIIEDQVVKHVDHKHLNLDVDFLAGVIPTAENLAVIFWQRIERALPSGELCELRLFESDNNSVVYRGAPVEVKRHGLGNQKEVAV